MASQNISQQQPSMTIPLQTYNQVGEHAATESSGRLQLSSSRAGGLRYGQTRAQRHAMERRALAAARGPHHLERAQQLLEQVDRGMTMDRGLDDSITKRAGAAARSPMRRTVDPSMLSINNPAAPTAYLAVQVPATPSQDVFDPSFGDAMPEMPFSIDGSGIVGMADVDNFVFNTPYTNDPSYGLLLPDMADSNDVFGMTSIPVNTGVPMNAPDQLFLGNGNDYLELPFQYDVAGMSSMLDNVVVPQSSAYYGYPSYEHAIPALPLVNNAPEIAFGHGYNYFAAPSHGQTLSTAANPGVPSHGYPTSSMSRTTTASGSSFSTVGDNSLTTSVATEPDYGVILTAPIREGHKANAVPLARLPNTRPPPKKRARKPRAARPAAQGEQ